MKFFSASILLLVISLLSSTKGDCILSVATSQLDASCTSQCNLNLNAALLTNLNIITCLLSGSFSLTTTAGTGDVTFNLDPALAALFTTSFSVTAGAGTSINLNIGSVTAFSGGLTLGNAQLTIQNTLSAASLTATNSTVLVNQPTTVSGAVQLGSASSMTVFGGGATFVQTTVGSLALSGGSTVSVNTGTALNTTTLTCDATSTIITAANITVTSATTIQGTLLLAGTQVQGAAQNAWLVVRNGVTFTGSAAASAVLAGNGGIDGTVSCSTNTTISVGNSPGTYYVNGDLNMDAGTTMQVDVDSQTNYDRIYVTGNFQRNGSLYAHFENGYTPNQGNVFTFVTHSSATPNSHFNIAHGDYFTNSFGRVDPIYSNTQTQFEYNSASKIAASVVPLMLLCAFALL